MTDYCSLIADAVDGLNQNTAKARRAVYERARVAQVAQLRALDPPISESVIVKERWALEKAIRKVETDFEFQLSSRSTAPRPTTIRVRRQVALGRPKPFPSGVPGSAEINGLQLPPAPTLAHTRNRNSAAKSLDLEMQSELGQATAKAKERSLKAKKLLSESGAPADSIASNIQAELLKSDFGLANDQQSVGVAEANEGHRFTQRAWHRALAKWLLTLSLLQAAGAALFWQWPHVRDAYQQISLILRN
jgi:hypothetical protein